LRLPGQDAFNPPEDKFFAADGRCFCQGWRWCRHLLFGGLGLLPLGLRGSPRLPLAVSPFTPALAESVRPTERNYQFLFQVVNPRQGLTNGVAGRRRGVDVLRFTGDGRRAKKTLGRAQNLPRLSGQEAVVRVRVLLSVVGDFPLRGCSGRGVQRGLDLYNHRSSPLFTPLPEQPLSHLARQVSKQTACAAED